MEELRILGIGLVGAGFSSAAFKRGLAMNPHFIGSDGGTSDLGPFSLGSGGMDLLGVRRDLKALIEGARSIKVPLIVGSIGTSGGDQQVDIAGDMVRDIARESGLSFRLALIKASVDKEYLSRMNAAGRVVPLGKVPPLNQEAIDKTHRVVGMMGVEPFAEALAQGADVIIAGRATDPAIFAGPCLRAGFDPGIAWHAARTIDKGVLMTEPVSAGSCAFIQLRKDHFIASPTREASVCTPLTVSGISIYENDNPFLTILPSGTLDATDSKYEALDSRSVKVWGAKFHEAERYTVKLEGSARVGYRAAVIMGIRDPILIGQIDPFLAAVEKTAARNLESLGIRPSQYRVKFRAYGRDGVMGAREPKRNAPAHELGIVVDAIGETQDIASAVARRIGAVAGHVNYEGRLTRSGNTANPFSGGPLAGGPVFEWSIWHILQPDSWRDTCAIEMVDL